MNTCNQIELLMKRLEVHPGCLTSQEELANPKTRVVLSSGCCSAEHFVARKCSWNQFNANDEAHEALKAIVREIRATVEGAQDVSLSRKRRIEKIMPEKGSAVHDLTVGELQRIAGKCQEICDMLRVGSPRNILHMPSPLNPLVPVSGSVGLDSATTSPRTSSYLVSSPPDSLRLQSPLPHVPHT